VIDVFCFLSDGVVRVCFRGIGVLVTLFCLVFIIVYVLDRK
jgi:hypothetical protein